MTSWKKKKQDRQVEREHHLPILTISKPHGGLQFPCLARRSYLTAYSDQAEVAYLGCFQDRRHVLIYQISTQGYRHVLQLHIQLRILGSGESRSMCSSVNPSRSVSLVGKPMRRLSSTMPLATAMPRSLPESLSRSSVIRPARR